MSLSSSTCLQGEYYVITGNNIRTCNSPVEVNTRDFADLQTLRTTEYTASKMTYQPFSQSYNNPPSEFELNRRARSLGLFLTREQSGLALVSKGPISEEYGDKLPRQSLPGIRDLNGDTTSTSGQRNRFPKAIMLPKIPSIKHPLERRIPNVMQQDKTSCDLPMPLTSLLTPRSKTTLDSSTYLGKKSKTGVSGESWSPREDNGQRLSSSSRLVVTSKSKGNLQSSSGNYYYRKFPHVILDRETGVIHQNQNRNRLNGNKNIVNKTGVSDTVRTTNELFNLTRSKTDMMAVEQLIARSANRLKSTSAVSGWLDGMTCNPKKLHQRKYTFV